jgi:hypothetical protein
MKIGYTFEFHRKFARCQIAKERECALRREPYAPFFLGGAHFAAVASDVGVEQRLHFVPGSSVDNGRMLTWMGFLPVFDQPAVDVRGRQFIPFYSS